VFFIFLLHLVAISEWFELEGSDLAHFLLSLRALFFNIQFASAQIFVRYKPIEEIQIPG
jgi:hypothetical protein